MSKKKTNLGRAKNEKAKTNLGKNYIWVWKKSENRVKKKERKQI